MVLIEPSPAGMRCHGKKEGLQDRSSFLAYEIEYTVVSLCNGVHSSKRFQQSAQIAYATEYTVSLCNRVNSKHMQQRTQLAYATEYTVVILCNRKHS